MKAKEKAIELRDKFIPSTKVFYNNDWKTDLTEAKKCALMCVDEVLNSNPHSNPFNTIEESTHKWWREVKHELNKL